MDPWRKLAKRASRQHGLVALHQAVSLGLSPRSVQDNARRLGWARIHRGVYALPGSLPTFDRQVMAALLACGPRSAASHCLPSSLAIDNVRDNGIVATGWVSLRLDQEQFARRSPAFLRQSRGLLAARAGYAGSNAHLIPGRSHRPRAW